MKRFASERVAGLMRRLGLDEDTAIESRLVSKTIESAQTRVEGYNSTRASESSSTTSDQTSSARHLRGARQGSQERGPGRHDPVILDRDIDAIVDRHLPASLSMDDWDNRWAVGGTGGHGACRRRNQA